MLWLALRFSRLPCEIFARGASALAPLAVAASDHPGAELIACNPQAEFKGVRSGMSAAAAWALASDLTVVTRDAVAERAALEGIAAWALQFTSTVSLAPPCEVLLEIGGSLRFFGGLNELWPRIEQELETLGYSAHLACAPTPAAAQLFARTEHGVRIQHRDTLQLSLARLPLAALNWPAKSTEILRDAGLQTIGECLQLPRAGLARRIGQSALDDLDRARGSLPDPRPTFSPPVHFRAKLTLPAPSHEAESLIFAVRRLLAELCGWLTATSHGAQRLALEMEHERRPHTRLLIDLAAASRDTEHLVAVLRERFARVTLVEPATAITLTSELTTPLSAQNASFFPDTRDETETVVRLVERLRARLGEQAVCGLGTNADYRPEFAWRVCDPGTIHEPNTHNPPNAAGRPLWLLTAPQPLAEKATTPCYGGKPLALIAGPERIESGWWEGSDVARDYFVARNPEHALFWIYRECQAAGRWYVHGFFS
jgi:protein ImuB